MVSAMEDERLISSPAAARQLGVHESRVRALAAKGRLGARKIAGRWVFDPDALTHEIETSRQDGRPLNPRNAFALLFIASDEEPKWIRGDVRSRLRRRLRQSSLADQLPRIRSRARRHDFRASDAALRTIRRDADFVKSGVSAARKYGADISALNILEGYYPERKLDEAVYRFALRRVPEERANLVLHGLVPGVPVKGRAVMPSAVVAADLLESGDQRTRRAGQRLLRSITER